MMPSPLFSQTFSIPFSQGQNNLAHAQNPNGTRRHRFFFFSFTFFQLLLCFYPKGKAKYKPTVCCMQTHDDERWLQPRFQAHASLQALSELCCTAVHTCKVVCSSERCRCLCECPPVVLYCQLRLRKEKPLVTLQ